MAAKPVSIFLTILTLLLAVSHQSVLAGMVGTETAVESARSQQARDYLNRVLASEDVATVLVAQGIDPVEARARVDSLSDAEVMRLARQIEQLPAGGIGTGFWVAAVIVIIYLAIFLVAGDFIRM